MNADAITHVFAAEVHHIIDAVHPETGCGLYSGETLAQVQARHPGAELMTMDAFLARKAEAQHTPIEWHVTTAEQYRDMLEVLPPAYWRDGGFLVGEPDDHDAATGRPRFRGYRHQAGDYFVSSRPLTVAEMRAALAVSSAGASR